MSRKMRTSFPGSFLELVRLSCFWAFSTPASIFLACLHSSLLKEWPRLAPMLTWQIWASSSSRGTTCQIGKKKKKHMMTTNMATWCRCCATLLLTINEFILLQSNYHQQGGGIGITLGGGGACQVPAWQECIMQYAYEQYYRVRLLVHRVPHVSYYLL